MIAKETLGQEQGRMQVSLARNWKMVNDFVLTISNVEIFMKKG